MAETFSNGVKGPRDGVVIPAALRRLINCRVINYHAGRYSFAPFRNPNAKFKDAVNQLELHRMPLRTYKELVYKDIKKFISVIMSDGGN